MIPKEAAFLWTGPSKSWLRNQSIASFLLLNPSFSVVPICEDEDEDPRGRLECVLWSDRARYGTLSVCGGLYFDTDIIFTKPVPEDLLDCDLLLPYGEESPIGHIAMLGSAPGSPYFRMLSEACEQKIKSGQVLAYQSLGVELANQMPPPIGTKIKWVPPTMVCPIGWKEARMCWEDHPVPTDCIGVHWYGGDHLSIAMEEKADEEWARTSRSVVARAIRQTLQAADAEMIREQHAL